MVKELEDTPHDEVAVLLDADARSVVGDSFDVQVRAAGSILLAHAIRNRRSGLTITTSPPETCHVASFDGEWSRALELLAAAEPTGTRAAHALPGTRCFARGRMRPSSSP